MRAINAIARRQLEMVRSENAPVEVSPPRDGYILRQYRETDRASYWRLFELVFETHSRLDDLTTAALDGGFFVIEHVPSGSVVASAAAAVYEREGHEQPGSLQWVMTDPAHLGKRLGRTVVAEATNCLSAAGYTRPYLSTDDWRLPAIHIYLSLGWRPLVFAEDMIRRWEDVFRRLGRTVEPDSFLVEMR